MIQKRCVNYFNDFNFLCSSQFAFISTTKNYFTSGIGRCNIKNIKTRYIYFYIACPNDVLQFKIRIDQISSKDLVI